MYTVTPQNVHNYVIAALSGIRITENYVDNQDLLRLMKILQMRDIVGESFKGGFNDLIFPAVESGKLIDREEELKIFNGFTWQQAIKGILFKNHQGIKEFTEEDFLMSEKAAYQLKRLVN